MRIDELQKKLLTAARALPPNTHVPFAFEKRIMARLQAVPALDPWTVWSQLLWRAAAPCVGIMLVMTAWTVYSQSHVSSTSALALDLEKTVWAPLTPVEETW